MNIDVSNISELENHLGQNLNFISDDPFEFRNINFKFSLGNNFSQFRNLRHTYNNGSIANQFNSIKHYIFDNCSFDDKITIRNDFELQLTFQNNCVFKELDFSGARFNKKIRFYECSFEEASNFENTKFEDLVDFWKSTFFKPIAFYKTDFLSTTVFSACTFNENVLFTYSLFKDKIVFRGATFRKGLDLSLAINSGEYNLFNMSLNNFDSKKHSEEYGYNQMISACLIPTINKKETFRIIKQHFQSNGDELEYVKYLKLEKKPIYEIVSQNLVETKLSEFWNYFHYLFDLLSLGLNKISNNNRNSYLLGLVFTILFGLIFFTFSALSLPNLHFEWNPINWYMKDFWKNYLTFMNPTHDVDLFNDFNPTGWTYFWQTWGRIFVGYGIYQTVQAFRKLK